MKRYLRELVILLAVFGGLPFDVMTDSPAYADPTNPPLKLTGGITTGLTNDKSVWVTAYGAKGDNSHDDTTAIQNALTAVEATGGVLYFPAGTYKVTSQIGTSSGASNVHIVGAGVGTTTISATIAGGGTTAYVFGLINTTNSSVESMKISGSFAQGVFVFQGSQNVIADLDISGATGSSTIDTGGVMMQDATYVTIERVYAHGNGGAGAVQGVDIGTYGGSTSNSYITVRNCRATSTAVSANYGFWSTSHSLVDGSYATGAILNNGSTTAGGYGILFYKTGSSVEFGQNRVIGNHVEATQGSGIYMQSQPNSVVANNRIKGVATAQQPTSLQVGGIAIGTAAASTGAGTLNGVSVIGNIISTSGQAGISAGGDEVSIVGNTIESSTTANIMLRDFHRGSVTGNTMKAGTVGIRAGAFSDVIDYASITGNNIREATVGIWLSATTNMTVVGNHVLNSANQGILLDTTCDTVALEDNNVSDSGQSADNTYDGISVVNSVRVQIKHNSIAGSRHRFGFSASGTSDLVEAFRNFLFAGHATYSMVGSSSHVDQRAESVASAAPTAGTWAVGDIVWNSAPAGGGIPGWICVTAGSPGTWKAMATLAP